MSDILKSAGYSMPTTTGVLHTAAAATAVIVLSAAVHNPTAGSLDVTLTIAKQGGGTIVIADAVAIAAGAFFDLPTKMILESEDTLDGFCSGAGCSIGINYDVHADDVANTSLAQQAAIDAIAAQAAAEAAAVIAQQASLKELFDVDLGAVAVDQVLDCALHNYFILEPTADITLTFSNVVAGTACVVELLGAGDHAITWAGATFVWDTDDTLAPVTATGTDSSIVAFISKNGTSFAGKLAFKLV